MHVDKEMSEAVEYAMWRFHIACLRVDGLLPKRLERWLVDCVRARWIGEA